MLTATHFSLIALATLGAHRIWNYEDLFAWPRAFLSRRGLWAKPLRCSACNGFWLAALFAGAWVATPEPWRAVAFSAFACYPFLRAGVWLYPRIDDIVLGKRSATEKPVAEASPAAAPSTSAPGCKTCGGVQKLKEENTKNLSYEKRFVLMTMFNDFKPSYSLTSVVLDQARMLAVNPKHLVQVWVTSICDVSDVPADLPANVEIKKILPPIPLPADLVDPKGKELFFGQVLHGLMVLGNATIITHDLLFITSYTTIAAAIHEKLGLINGFTWYHTCHSAPAAERPTGPVSKYRASLPAGHKLICLAESQASALAAYYGTTVEQVAVVPNARDIRSLLGASPRISDFIRRHQLLEADIVQVLPLSTPRAKAKGIEHVIDIFGELALYYKMKVRLVVPNAHANNNHGMINELKDYAAQRGLGKEELIFTSDDFPELAAFGLPTSDITALFQVSNLFIFPTVSEACSMTLMEAALAGCLLVLNDEVASLRDIIPAVGAHYVSWNKGFKPVSFATLIHNTLADDVRNVGKRAVLRSHSWDAIGSRLRAVVSG